MTRKDALQIKHFMIISSGRSGSTSLRLMLNNSNEAAICHGEILGRNRVLGISHKTKDLSYSAVERKKHPKKFFNDLLMPENFKTVGFKLLNDQLFLTNNFIILDWFFERKPSIILLWRRDLVARFLSSCRLRSDAGSVKEWHENISVSDIVSDCITQILTANKILRFLNDEKLDYLPLYFEDFITDVNESNKVMQFIGIKGAFSEIIADNRSKKNSLEKLSETPEVFKDARCSILRNVALEDVADKKFRDSVSDLLRFQL